MKCGICREPLLDSQLQWGLDCNRHIGHSTHESYDCNECGFKDGKVQPQSILQKQPLVPEMTEVERRKQMSASRINEPLGASGSGVGAANGQSFVGSVLSAVSNRLAPLFSRAGAPVENLPPRELLALKIPLKEMVSKYGYDITELINDHRLNINDFFEHGYTVGEMIEAFPSRMNMKDGMTVMSLLGIQAEHFRCVPDLVSADVMAKKIGYKASDLVDRFDLKYKSPVTDGGDAWTLQELVDNGLTLADMQRAGLECEVQWDELKQTVAPLHLPQLAQRFGATPEAIASQLVSANVTKQLSAGYLQRQKEQQEFLEQERRRQEYILQQAIRHHAPPPGSGNVTPGNVTAGAPVIQASFNPAVVVRGAPQNQKSQLFEPQLFLSKDPVKFVQMAPSINSPASFKLTK